MVEIQVKMINDECQRLLVFKILMYLPHYNIDDNDDAEHFGDHFKLGVNVSDYM